MARQRTSLQSYGTSQCALAMVFDLHVGVPDAERQRVCDAFLGHPDRVPQKAAKAVDDRSGNHVMLSLYEVWLWQTHRSIFDAAQGSFVTADIHARDGLAAGALQAGPAAIVEDETTIIIPVSRNAIQQPDGCIDIIRKDGAA